MKYRIMLADDEPIMRKALQTLVEWHQFECEVVYVAANGNEVIENLEKVKPDILITDIKMPGMDGIEISKYIWEKKLATKVIILTAYADFSYAKSAIRYNVVEYVTKTGSFDELLGAVERCKMMLHEDRLLGKEEKEAKRDAFFRGVYDGNIYDDISFLYEKLALEKSPYVVVFFKILMDEVNDKAKRVRLYDSLKNFFYLAFSEQMIHGMFYQKDIYGLVLKCSEREEEVKQYLNETCNKVIDMMDNFMELYVYVGISRIYEDIGELPDAYEEAEIAINCSGLEYEEKLLFFTEDMKNQLHNVVNMDTKQQLIKESIAYIDKHYQEPMSVSDVARAVGTSTSYLSRIFKESTGETIIRTINHKRIEKAKIYLKDTDYKVYEVADILGFENVTYFSRFFKKHTGISPKEYKESWH